MLSGAVLAGGQNRRMNGYPKALLPFPAEPILALQLREMNRCCEERLVISEEQALRSLAAAEGALVVPDAEPGLGPLGGLATALAHARGDVVWLVACDMPYISADAALCMLERMEGDGADAAVPVGDDGRVHPLHALYRTDCLAAARAALAAGKRGMREFLAGIRCLEVDPSQFAARRIDWRFTANLNTPEAYERALPAVTSSLRFRRKALPVSEAQRRIAPFIRLGGVETVTIGESLGRIIAADMIAPHPVPHFSRSGYDGYALRAKDTANASPEAPAALKVIDAIPCGAVSSAVIGKGTAARIMTGAAVPAGADAVIMLEMTETVETAEADGRPVVLVKRAVSPGDNIAPPGSEFAAGVKAIAAGARICAGIVAILAAFGHTEVAVRRRPEIAILATGSELLEPHEPLVNGKIRNSNSRMVAALVAECGGEPALLPKVGADPAQVLDAVSASLDRYDAVVTTGGVSVGDRDPMVDLFERWDGRLLFNKVAMRPGSPTSVAVRGGKPLFALSGNPGAAFVGFQLFVRPFIHGFVGVRQPWLTPVRALLAADFAKPGPYPRYVRGKHRIEDGRLVVEPVGPDKSSVIVSLADATCLIVIPAGGRGLAAGDPVDALLLQDRIFGIRYPV